MRTPLTRTFSPQALLLQASVHCSAGEFFAAEKLYRAILCVQPDDAAITNDLARTLQNQGKLEEAIEMFRRVVSLRPDAAVAHRNLGVILCEQGRLEESFASLRRCAELTHRGSINTYHSDKNIPLHKVQHDYEYDAYVHGLNQTDDQKGDSSVFHIADCDRVAGRALKQDVLPDVVTAQWQNSHPQIVVIDNFLTDEALSKLQHFCWRSTIWRQIYASGYLGAMPEHGMGSPLLAQISQELRSTYPVIFSKHLLRHFWGFKYDSRLNGIGIHADFAAVNVNFWITPDEANLDPSSGGLVLWDKGAPLDWDFSRYNDDVAAAQNFLLQAEARRVTIPYRFNRAIIFDSNLFHKTDQIVFKEGYLNRRINITLLYGRREDRERK